MDLNVKGALRSIFLDHPVDRLSIESSRALDESISQATPTTPDHLARCTHGLVVLHRRIRNFEGIPTLEDRLTERYGPSIQPLLGAAIRTGIQRNLFTVSLWPEDFSEIRRSSEKEDLPFFLQKSDEELAALARDPSADFSEGIPRFSRWEVCVLVLVLVLFLVGIFYSDTVLTALGLLIYGPFAILLVYNFFARADKRRLILLGVVDFLDTVRFVLFALPTRIVLRVFNRLPAS